MLAINISLSETIIVFFLIIFTKDESDLFLFLLLRKTINGGKHVLHMQYYFDKLQNV